MNKFHDLAEKGDVTGLYEMGTESSEINAVNEKGDTPMQVAVICRNYPIVRALRELGAEFDTDQAAYSVFEPAVLNNDLKMVNLLAELDANVNTPLGERKPIFWAIQESNTEIALRLLELGVDPNTIDSEQSGGGNLLREAAGEGNIEIVNDLIMRGADLNIVDDEGITADQLAEAWGHIHVAATILQARRNLKKNLST